MCVCGFYICFYDAVCMFYITVFYFLFFIFVFLAGSLFLWCVCVYMGVLTLQVFLAESVFVSFFVWDFS